jgi:hypothetical protein
LPQAGFLFSIAGLSVTLVGFSGLVAALRRDTPQTVLQNYRVRQIPEMALISALVALITLPLADSVSDHALALRVAAVVALALTVGHVLLLIERIRHTRLAISGADWAAASVVDGALIVLAVIVLISGTPGSFEWLLVVLVARPAVAFVLALTDPRGA